MKFRLLPIATETVRCGSGPQASGLSSCMDEDGQLVMGTFGCHYHMGAGPMGELYR